MKFHKNRIFIGILLIIIVVSTSNKNAHAGDDKLLHFGVSSLFGAVSESYLHYKTDLKASQRILWGTTLGTIPGLVKELIDSTEKGNHFSGGDLAADIAGAFVGALIGNFVNNIIQVKIEKKGDNKTFTISLSYKF